MSSRDDGALRIPIEIKTDDLNEIQALIRDIDKTEQEIKPKRGKVKDTTSRSAFVNPPEEDQFGIFNEEFKGGRLPSKGKDTKSAAPFQRENEFAKMQETQKELQANQLGMQEVLGMGTKATGFAKLVGGRGTGGLGSIVSGIAGKAFLPIAVITTITGLIKTGLDTLLAPGGPFDRRFKRDISNEVVSTLDRAKKAEIAQSLTIIRVSTNAGVRGTASTIQGERFAAGNSIYDSNMEARGKGLL